MIFLSRARHAMVPVAAIPHAHIVDSLPQAVFICDAAGTYVRINPAYAQLTGYGLDELIGQQALARIHDGAELPVTGETACFPSHISRHRDGRASRVRLSLGRWPQPDGAAPLYVGTALPEASPRETTSSAGWNDGFHDPWTQLPNAAWFRERAALKLQSARQRMRPCALLAVEIDQMARVRDSQGDEMLGQLLQLCGHRIRGTLGPEAVLATVGGGLLVCLLDGDQREVDARIDALLRNLSLPLQGAERSLRLTASIGAALTAQEARIDVGELLHRARVALGAAKAAGGGQSRWFRNAMQSQAEDRLQLEGLLREALERNQFSLVFQPQLHLATGRIRHMEALLRWHCPALGPVSPAAFVPVAEDLGLIVPIGEWVMREACREVGRLRRLLALKGAEPPRVAVNVSAHQLLAPGLVDMVQSALADAGLGPEHLEIEITESIFLNDADRALATLESLRQLGIELAIDDFGTGYSSFSYLTQFPFNRLKIDRSLVMNVDQPGKGYAIVAAIVSLAHALGMKVTAEGMETPAQAEQLQALQCDDIQGYGFHRPLQPKVLERLLLSAPPG
jgi:diguanylate cyclase (GGDEF)-like protein/PAS domain S-box-containing protein